MKTFIPTLLSAVLCATLVSACSDSQQAEQVDSSEIITVGAVLPFSGGLETFGEQAKAGIDLAVQEINDAGGIDGKAVEVIYEDNQTNPKVSVEKTKDLVAKQAVAIVGPITSDAREAMTPVTEKARVPLLYATNYEGGVCNDYVFSFNSVPNQELAQLIPEVAGRKGASFYMLGTDYLWPQRMFAQAKKEIAKFDGTVKGTSFVNWGQQDYSDEIHKIMESKAKVLLFAVPGIDGINFIKQARKLGLTKRVTIAFLGFSETYIHALGDTSDMDIYVTVPFISTSKDNQEFVTKITEANEGLGDVSQYARTHYNAVKTLASALQKSKNYTSAGAENGLKGLTTDDVEINPNNQANLGMYLGKMENNKLQEVKSFGVLNGQVKCSTSTPNSPDE